MFPVTVRRHVRTDHQELIAAKARHGVAFPHPGFQALCRLAQQFVAGRVPQGIVDLLEPVQVEEHGQYAAALTFGPLDCLCQTIHRQVAVGQPGQLVVVRLVYQLLFGLQALVDLALQALVLFVQSHALLRCGLEVRAQHQVAVVEA